jgi:hypothetical protein
VLLDKSRQESSSSASSQCAEKDPWALKPQALAYAREKGYSHPNNIIDGWTLLHHACQATMTRQGMGVVVYQLCDMMNVYSLSCVTTAGYPTGWSALHMLANGRDPFKLRPGLLKVLLQSKADPLILGTKGETCLFQAAGTGHTDAKDMLIACGLDPHFKREKDGLSVVDMAVKSNSEMKEDLQGLGVRSQWRRVFEQSCKRSDTF